MNNGRRANQIEEEANQIEEESRILGLDFDPRGISLAIPFPFWFDFEETRAQFEFSGFRFERVSIHRSLSPALAHSLSVVRLVDFSFNFYYASPDFELLFV